MSTETTSPGSVLAGKFRVERELGRGAMGVVLLATDQLLGRKVALKLLEPSLAHDETARARLLREANVASRLTGRHVARVLEAGLLEDGAPYVAFEHLEGETLEAVVDRHERLPVPVAVGFVLEALDGLQEAHDLGLVHRDLKPANLFLARTKDGPAIVKVLDFGLARAEDSARLTATGDTLGSPAYMAPEQLRAGETVGPAADVWALGVTLFELLTGELPFAGDSVPAIAHKILRAPPTALAAVRDGVPAEIEQVITRCLCKAPAERFADAREMRIALEAASPHGPGALAFRTTALELGPGDGAAPAPDDPRRAPPRPISTRTSDRRAPGGRSPFALFVAVVLVTVGAGALVVAMVTRRATTTAQVSAADAGADAHTTLVATPEELSDARADDAADDAPQTDASSLLTEPASSPPLTSREGGATPGAGPDPRALARAEPRGRCLCVGRNAHGTTNLCHAAYVRARWCVCAHTDPAWLCRMPTAPCDRAYARDAIVGTRCEGFILRYSADLSVKGEPASGRIACTACLADAHFREEAGAPCYGYDEDGVARRGVIACNR